MQHNLPAGMVNESATKTRKGNGLDTKMSGNVFKIDLSESFEHLPNAPIVEAVIHWRARAEKKSNPLPCLSN